MSDYTIGQRLDHHSGSIWEVDEAGLPDGAFEGYYRIRCVLGSDRDAEMARENTGQLMRVHRDYLHGDGWSVRRGA